MNQLLACILFILIFLTSSCSSKPVNKINYVCPNVKIHSNDEFKLNDVESRLICGQADSLAYRKIPLYQAEVFLKGYFQNKGYSNITIKYHENLLEIWTNDKNEITSIEVISADDNLNQYLESELRRKFKKFELSPSNLSKMENYSHSYLRDHSYACSSVSSNYYVDDHLVELHIKNLEHYKFGHLNRDAVEGIRSEAFLRYYPFSRNESFKAYKLALTEKRFLRDNVVQGTYFQESCNNSEFQLTQSFIIGPSKTIRYGVGANTERGAILRGKWSNQRYGSMASLLEASIELSLTNQKMSFISNHYHWPKLPRLSLRSSLDLSRDDYSDYTESSLKLRPHFEYKKDFINTQWTTRIGPSFILSKYDTDDNKNLEETISTGAIEGVLNIKSHIYELFDAHPQEGSNTIISFDFRHPSFGFSDPLLKLDISTTNIFNLGPFSRGDIVLATKAFAATTIISDGLALDKLEPSVKFYAGGSDDIRGYKLNQLPMNGGLGALSKIGLKLEIRKTNFFNENIEAFTFLDSIKIGEDSLSVDDVIYYSPGIGLRWSSPIGIVQGFASRGLATDNRKDDGNLFYVGLGGIF